MDPFSITVGVVGLADVCIRVIKYLKNFKAVAGKIQGEINHLIIEVESLKTVVESITVAIDEAKKQYFGSVTSPRREANLYNLLQNASSSLKQCDRVGTELEELVLEICGESGPTVTGKLDGLAKERRRRKKVEDLDLSRIRYLIATEKENLQILFHGINLYNNRASQDTLDRISRDIQSFKSQMASVHDQLSSSDTGKGTGRDDKAMLDRLMQFQLSIESVTTASSIMSANRFFNIPRPVSSSYTGRGTYLQRLRSILSSDKGYIQRRFVVWGIGGSGKTEFCCKFAQDNRESFWGVFWIDASSHDRIKQTYAEISKDGEVDPNPNAAMHWLSNLRERWLLIMDNADDPDIKLDEYFPKGDRGCILITTRNPAHIVYGNLEPRCFEFQGMEDDEANALLANTAQLTRPLDPQNATLAARIARKLGFLALALIHAGAVIQKGMCGLGDYLSCYDLEFEQIRRLSRSPTNAADRHNTYTSAYATFEISYRAIEKKDTEAARDAIQILKIFSFFYFKNIRFDILKKAIENCRIEEAQMERSAQEQADRPLTLYQKYRNMRLSILAFLLQDRSPPPLPHFIREDRQSQFFNNNRVRYAILELTQLSLITHDKSNDSFSMHPLVHRWVRERPWMSTSEQAVWSHAAATTLGHSILLPPDGNTEHDEIFRRDILPHLDHVREFQAHINKIIHHNRRKRWFGLVNWPGAGSRFDRNRAVMYAKFSIVFMQNGRWKEAELLQLEVKRFTERALGLEHPSTRRITLALATTYFNQGRGDEAAGLQAAVLQACQDSLGPNDHETLMAMDTLGQTKWQLGLYSEARKLQEEAVDGLAKLKTRQHEDTLSAINKLGRTMTRFYEYLDQARTLLSEAFNGMTEKHGPNHLETLRAKEDLAMVNIQMGEELTKASAMLQEVLDRRKEKLGKENPYTLLAMVNFARSKMALGEYIYAENLVRTGLEIADRNLGPGHIGTLMGRTVLGSILTHQSRFSEAETTFNDTIEKLQHISISRGKFHPDRLGAMMELVRCYRRQGKFDQGIELCNTIIQGLKSISQREHPLERKCRDEQAELISMQRGERERDQAARDDMILV